MSVRGSIISIALFLSFGFLTAGITAQKKPSQTPDEKQRKVKREDDRVFRDWPKSDVKLIITPEEEAAYNKLQTPEERENFIHEFWNRRDPSPDTEENEYKDEYYERIAYANEHFASGKAGWLTDRGRIYVKWGKPSEIESHPAGGRYQRMSYKDDSVTTYPFEIWFYRYLPGVGSGIEIEFVDPTGSGEYRIARNPFEKDAGPYSGTREGSNGFGDPNSLREQDSPFHVTDLLKNLESSPPVEGRGARSGITGTPVEDDNVLNFEIKSYYFLQTGGGAIAAFTIQTDNHDLVFQNSGGLQTAQMNIFGKLWTVTDKSAGAFQDVVSTTAAQEELTEAKGRKSVYQKAVMLPPGRYRLDLLVRDINSGARGFQQHSFTIPKLAEETRLQISSLVLAAKLESLKDEPGSNQFRVGRNKVVPNITGEFHRGAPVGVYLQVYNFAIDMTTLRPAVDVEYVLLKDGRELRKEAENWVGMSEVEKRLTLAHLFESADLIPGEYELQIRIRDHALGQTMSPSAKFTVVP
ncbi:MAG TPA: GWxTD domain-containing protein [Pyrinomonadaceae bacterium]|nr:GWxTD domain-containing protein [Pyrinomonadaceae bacterium]